MQSIENVINFWIGEGDSNLAVSRMKMQHWLIGSTQVRQDLASRFGALHQQIAQAETAEWHNSPRGKLAKIILLDQFSRQLFTHDARAFAQDIRALEACVQGIAQEDDRELSLIERAHFYLPLAHSEQSVYQRQAVAFYQLLTNLSFEETRFIYERFLNFASDQYSIIRRFGRFPERNAILGRKSTSDEMDYLASINYNQTMH